MPNWCEGTLKVRGSYENVMKFFNEGLAIWTVGFEVVGKDRRYVEHKTDPDDWRDINEETNVYFSMHIKNGKEPHVNGTYRAFITSDDIYFEKNGDDPVTAPVEFRQAWGIIAKNWQELSKKYGVDFRLYGFERGMEFCQEVEILNGRITINKEIKYDDWEWECPMPCMGG